MSRYSGVWFPVVTALDRGPKRWSHSCGADAFARASHRLVVAVVVYELTLDRDVGWRIDYQIASAGLAARAMKAEIDRAPSYAERWSDHAPLVVTYDV
jgi:endonuclease/exonuclease/phosphatase family metal-dependent hydrolase